MLKQIITEAAPPPAGNYSQAIMARGEFLFISGQTPRLADGTRLRGRPFHEDADQVMKNLRAIADAADYDLRRHCAKVVIYLRDLGHKPEFDRIFEQYFEKPLPARSIVQSSFKDFSIEVEAILVR